MEVVVRFEAAQGAGQDRAAALDVGGGRLLVVADGAGGTVGGAEAAQGVIDWFRALEPTPDSDWGQMLLKLDRRLSSNPSCGETTAVVAFLTDEWIVGASVGDSGAWMLQLGAWSNLLEQQRRRPLLGSGSAVPIGFGPFATGERVLLGSDGLFDYVDAERLSRLASISPLESAADELVQAARLRSGRLQDDIAVILAG